MAATSKTARTARARSTKKTSRPSAAKKRSATARGSARKKTTRASAATKTRPTRKTATRSARAGTKHSARKAPARKRTTKAKATTRKTTARKKTSRVKATHTTAQDRRYLEQHADELSPSTERAHWIHDPSEREDHPGETLATRSHEVIRQWAEERGGTPATVSSSKRGGEPRVLRINFPGYGGKNLRQISWDEWFEPFDDRQLTFVFQQHKSDGSQSNFFRLDSPSREHA